MIDRREQDTLDRAARLQGFKDWGDLVNHAMYGQLVGRRRDEPKHEYGTDRIPPRPLLHGVRPPPQRRFLRPLLNAMLGRRCIWPGSRTKPPLLWYLWAYTIVALGVVLAADLIVMWSTGEPLVGWKP